MAIVTAYYDGLLAEHGRRSCARFLDSLDWAWDWTAMRLLTGILHPLRRNRIAVLGARSAPKRYCQTSQRLCRNIKDRALGWSSSPGPTQDWLGDSARLAERLGL